MEGQRDRGAFLALLTCLALATTACTIGPKYQTPVVQVPAGYKELNGWKVAQPRDDIPRGKWWEIFQDARLNALAEQIDVSNQNIAIAEAQLRGARAAINVARAALFHHHWACHAHWLATVPEPCGGE